MRLSNEYMNWNTWVWWKLTFQPHLQYTYKKICNKIDAITKSRAYIDEKEAVLLYKSPILPILDYGDFVYITATQTVLHKLQQIQKVALSYVEANVHQVQRCIEN